MKTPSQIRSELWPSLPYASDLDIECEAARTQMLVARDLYDNSGLGQREECWQRLVQAESAYTELMKRAVRQF